MKTKEDICKNWLPRYTGTQVGDFASNHSALLFLLGEGTVFPGAAEVQQSVQVQFIQVFDPLDARPGKKLLAEDGLEFLEGRGFDAAAHGIGQVCVDRLRHRDPWPRFRYAWLRDFIREVGGGGSAGVGIGGAEPTATAVPKGGRPLMSASSSLTRTSSASAHCRVLALWRK